MTSHRIRVVVAAACAAALTTAAAFAQQTPFANDRYAVILGQSTVVSQTGQNLSYTTTVSDRAREGMTITVNLRCTAGSRVLILTYAAIGRR